MFKNSNMVKLPTMSHLCHGRNIYFFKYTFMKSYICVVFGPIELANVHDLKKRMLILVNYECSSGACT